MKFHATIAGWMLVFVAATAGAQVVRPPVRPFRPVFGGGAPPDPTRSHQELMVSGNMLGGYEDNLSSPAAADPFRPAESGYTGFGETTLRYFVGRDVRSIEVTGRGYMNSYQGVGLEPRFGTTQTFRGRTTLGRRTDLQVVQGFRSEPFFSIGAFGSFDDTAPEESPDRNPNNGLGESRSWGTNVSATLNRHWTRRSSTDISYGYAQQDFAEGAGGSDSRDHSLSVGFNRTFSRTMTLTSSYRRLDSELVPPTPGSQLSVVNDTGDAGFSYTRNLSRTRQVSFLASGGATHLNTTNGITHAPLAYWTPATRGGLRVDVGRSWSVAADYQRTVSILQGLSPEPYASHIGRISTGGYIGRHMEAAFTAGYSTGLAGQSQDNIPGEVKAYTGAAQVRFSLIHGWSSVVSFNHYQHQLNAAASQSLGAPRELDRNTIRVGFSWSLPLIGAVSEVPAVGGGN